MILTRRNFLGGLLAAPAIVRASSLMPVKPLREVLLSGQIESFGWDLAAGDCFYMKALRIQSVTGIAWMQVVGPKLKLLDWESESGGALYGPDLGQIWLEALKGPAP
jgi:hypothetical protein